MILAPSILAADFSRLNEEIDMFNRSEADWLHLDVMDGRFVPNITFGMMIVNAIRKQTEKPLDVHLMIVEPEKYVEAFADAGADHISVHIEASVHLHRTIEQIRKTGAKAGVAINPHTPVIMLEDIIKDVDIVCMMSVNPGFGGQKFIENTYHKIIQTRELITTKSSSARIVIDGGVTLDNVQKLLENGADVLVAGSSVFGANDPLDTIRKFKTF